MNPKAARIALGVAAWVLLSGASYTAHREVAEGNAALGKGDAKAAISHYERARGADPEDPAIAYNEGTARLAAGDADGAVEALAPVAGAAGGVAGRAAFNLGNALLSRATRADGPGARDDLKGAVQAFRQAVQANPDDPAARRNLQIAATRLKDLPPPQPQSQSKPRRGADNPSGDRSKDPSQAKDSTTQDASKGQDQPGAQQEGRPERNDPSGRAQGDREREASGREGAGRELPEDVTRALSALRRKEAGVMREALRRSMEKRAPAQADSGEPDW